MRMALWWNYLLCIENSSDEPIRVLSSTFLDQHSHMSICDGDVKIGKWEKDNKMLVATGPVFTCLVGNIMTMKLLRIPGVIEYLRQKRIEFHAAHGRYPSIKMFGHWLDHYLFKSASVKPQYLTDDMVIDVLRYPALIPRLLKRIKPNTKFLVSCPNPHDEPSVLIIQAISPAKMKKRAFYYRVDASQWSEVIVTPLPPAFLARCQENPSEFFRIVGTSRTNTTLQGPSEESEPSSSLADLCSDWGFNAKAPVLIKSESLGSVRFQAVRGSYLCCWLAVCNAVASYDLDCTVLVAALEQDIARNPSDREMEGLYMKEIANKLHDYLPKIQLRKKKLVKLEDLIRQCLSPDGHLPRIVMIGWFHAFCIINGHIHCSSETSPIPLTMENLRRCSDFIHADFSELRMVVHREVIYTRLVKERVPPGLSRSERRKLRRMEHPS